jgi:hypothetical protein
MRLKAGFDPRKGILCAHIAVLTAMVSMVSCSTAHDMPRAAAISDVPNTAPSGPTIGVENDPEAKRIADHWLETLKKSQYAKVHYRNVRTRTEHPADPSAPPSSKLISSVTVEADAAMEPHAFWVVASDDDPKQGREPGQPSLVVSFYNGEIRERLWYPALKQYRTKRYASTRPEGGTNTE